MLDIRKGRIHFNETRGTVAQVSEIIEFDHYVANPQIALNGYHATYVNDDHHIRKLLVDINAALIGNPAVQTNKIRVTGKLHLRDKNDDDTYDGWIDYVLFIKLGARVPTDINP